MCLIACVRRILWIQQPSRKGVCDHASSSQSSGTFKSACGTGPTWTSGFLGEAVCSLRTGVTGRTGGVAIIGLTLVEATGWGCFVVTDDQPLPHGDPLEVATGLEEPGAGAVV